jgi:hypothetical protein
MAAAVLHCGHANAWYILSMVVAAEFTVVCQIAGFTANSTARLPRKAVFVRTVDPLVHCGRQKAQNHKNGALASSATNLLRKLGSGDDVDPMWRGVRPHSVARAKRTFFRWGLRVGFGALDVAGVRIGIGGATAPLVRRCDLVVFRCWSFVGAPCGGRSLGALRLLDCLRRIVIRPNKTIRRLEM